MTMEKEQNYELYELSFRQKLVELQNELYAPKTQFNKFGGYNYRNCEDIYNAVKPLLKKYGMTLTMEDTVKTVGERYYVEATARLTDVKTQTSISVTAYAREEDAKKGQDGSQITGASSSYARKYALNGLFLIDDVRDSDVTNTHGKVYENDELNNKTYRSWLDKFFEDKPERLAKFLEYYKIKTTDKLDQVMGLEEIDQLISKLKREKNV